MRTASHTARLVRMSRQRWLLFRFPQGSGQRLALTGRVTRKYIIVIIVIVIVIVTSSSSSSSSSLLSSSSRHRHRHHHRHHHHRLRRRQRHRHCHRHLYVIVIIIFIVIRATWCQDTNNDTKYKRLKASLCSVIVSVVGLRKVSF